jgi:hypothetical protein
MNTAKKKDKTNARHHTLPIFYLEHFSENDRVVTRSRETGFERSRKPRETANETGFYTLEKPDGSYTAFFEEGLESLEARTAPVISRLNSDLCLLPYGADRHWLAMYIAVQARRTPEARIQDMALKDLIVEEQIGVYRNCNTTDLAPENREQVSAAIREAMQPRTSDHMLGIVAAARTLTGLMKNRRWTLMMFDEPSLMTCDHPVIALSGNDFCAGFGKASTILFPIGSRRLLIMHKHGATVLPDQHARGNDRIASEANQIIQRAAFRESYMAPSVARANPAQALGLRAAGFATSTAPSHLVDRMNQNLASPKSARLKRTAVRS